jgi:hypothetical protein
MTTGTATPACPIDSESAGGFLLHSTVHSGALDVEASASSTPMAARLVDRFSSYMVPLVATAAIWTPVPPGMRRIFSRANASRSEIRGVDWLHDEFVYTEELATIEQVRALNALLALPAVEGFPVDLTD